MEGSFFFFHSNCCHAILENIGEKGIIFVLQTFLPFFSPPLQPFSSQTMALIFNGLKRVLRNKGCMSIGSSDGRRICMLPHVLVCKSTPPHSVQDLRDYEVLIATRNSLEPNSSAPVSHSEVLTLLSTRRLYLCIISHGFSARRTKEDIPTRRLEEMGARSYAYSQATIRFCMEFGSFHSCPGLTVLTLLPVTTCVCMYSNLFAQSKICESMRS